MAKKHKNSSRRASLRRKRKMRALLVLGAVGFFVVFGGSYAALKTYVEQTGDDEICHNIFIGSLDVSGMTEREAKRALSDQMEKDESRTVTLEVEEHSLEVYLKDFGYENVDTEKLIQKALKYGKKGSLWKRYMQMKDLEEEPYVLEEKYQVDQKQTKQLLEEKVTPLLKQPENAAITRKSSGKLKVTKEKDGQAVDVSSSVDELNDYLNEEWEHEDFAFQPVIVTNEAEIKKSDLSQIKDELGSFATEAGTGERWMNLKNGVSKLNGIILMPEEELSVYEMVAPYNDENGYVEADSYETEEENAYGGGICQVASTLYNAVLNAELEVEERAAYKVLPKEVEPGREALVTGEGADLRFKNSLKEPIYIYGEIDADNQMRFVIYGKETRDKKRSIDYETKTSNVTAPKKGQEVVLWKVIYENDKEIERTEVDTSFYESSDSSKKDKENRAE